jgi:hypothetical protein
VHPADCRKASQRNKQIHFPVADTSVCTATVCVDTARDFKMIDDSSKRHVTLGAMSEGCAVAVRTPSRAAKVLNECNFHL